MTIRNGHFSGLTSFIRMSGPKGTDEELARYSNYYKGCKSKEECFQENILKQFGDVGDYTCFVVAKNLYANYYQQFKEEFIKHPLFDKYLKVVYASKPFHCVPHPERKTDGSVLFIVERIA